MNDIINSLLNEDNTISFFIELPDDTFKLVYPEMRKELESFMMEYKPQEIMNEDEKARLFKEIEDNKAFLDLNKDAIIPEKVELIEFLISCMEKILNAVPYRKEVEVYIEVMNDGVTPLYAHPTDAGCDLHISEDVVLSPHETKILHTGIKVAIPNGWMINVYPRSGLSAKTGLRIANSVGVIDSDYRGEIGVPMTNTSEEYVSITKGERIAQIIIAQAPMIKFKQVDDINTIQGNRGGGFGSTGV